MVYLVLALILLAFVDFPSLLRKGKRKELLITGGIYVVGALLAILYKAGVDLPSPLYFMDRLMIDILHISY